MISLAYVSTATRPMTPDDLRGILETSRTNNRTRDVTGMLLYKGQTFLQFLEGPEPAVRERYDRIGQDPRHTGVVAVSERRIEHREFSEWTMGFEDLDAIDAVKLRGFTPLLARPFDAQAFLAEAESFPEIVRLVGLLRVHA